MSTGRGDRLFPWAFTLVVLCTLVDRAWLTYTTMGYASDDLVVVWLAAVDYSHGLFHEPFFYGQDYGVMLEALIAAPFVRLGFDPITTVAVIFALFTIAPFLAFAWYYQRRHEWWSALLLAAMPVLLPVEHGLQITALNGIVLTAIVPLAWLVKNAFMRTALVTMVLSFAVFVNPNAALIAVPIGLYELFQHRTERNAYLGILIGLVPVSLVLGVVRAFFQAQRAEVVNTIFDWRMHFKPHLILEAFKRLDSHFAWLSPLSGHAGSIVLILLIGALVIHIRQRDTRMVWALVGTLALILLSFCFAKVHDGYDSIFFPLSRIFLGLPLVLAWALGSIQVRHRKLEFLTLLVLATVLIHTTWRITTAKEVYTNALQDQNGLPVRTWSVDGIKGACERTVELAQGTQADHIIIIRGNDPITAQFMAYGIPVFHPEAVGTWMADHDRRSFQRYTRLHEPTGTALIMGGDSTTTTHLASHGLQVSLVDVVEPMALVTNAGSLPISEMLELVR